MVDIPYAAADPNGDNSGRNDLVEFMQSEGIMKMSLGEKAQLHIPACKAYGAAGNGPVPPNADLVFDVHLLKITPQTSCLGPGQHGGVQRKHHEYAQLADQLLGRAPQTGLEQKLPDERQPMPLTSDMPR